MTAARLENVNFTASDPDATARWMCEVLGWRIRWQGAAIHGGKSIHVGSDNSYVAIYHPGHAIEPGQFRYGLTGGLNHIAVVVDDLDAAEDRVKAAGFTPVNHADYDPGRRFYFRDGDGVEFELVEY